MVSAVKLTIVAVTFLLLVSGCGGDVEHMEQVSGRSSAEAGSSSDGPDDLSDQSVLPGERGSGDAGQRRVVGEGDLYAFLVAVREYDPAEMTSLRFTENDVTDLARTLKTVGYKEDNILLMTQKVGATKTRMLPTSKNIRKQLSLLIRELKRDDTLLLAFSGHGLQFKDQDDAYYCPADASITDRSTLISMNNVYKQLDSVCRARTKILLLDACRNDPLANLGRSTNSEIDLEGGPQKIALPGSLTAFFSCSTGEVSYEHPDIKHGVFLNFVIEALGGKGDLDHDGTVSLAELEQFSVKQTQRFVRVNLSRAQTPERRGEARGLVTLARLPTPAPVSVASSDAASTGDSTLGSRPDAFSRLESIHRADVLSRLEASRQEAAKRREELRLREPFSRPEPFRFEHPTDLKPQPVNPVVPTEPQTFDVKPPAKLDRDDVITNSIGMKLQGIPAGEFVMGSLANERGRRPDETPHKVEITQAFYLQTTEVTQSQWESVMGTRPWSGKDAAVDGSDLPATYVSWTDAVQFCRLLSEKEEVTYRLPTEAEWEYACRAGTRTAYSFGDSGDVLSEYAWWGGNSDDDADKTHQVGLKRPSPWGLYDMHGNVWEWCSDWYGAYEYEESGSTDPQGTESGRLRVYRGGKWQNSTLTCRSADREKNPPGFQWNVLGFRVLRTSD